MSTPLALTMLSVVRVWNPVKPSSNRPFPCPHPQVEEEILSTPFALIVLSAISVLVALHCEFLTEVIQTFSADTGLSQPFIGGCGRT